MTTRTNDHDVTAYTCRHCDAVVLDERGRQCCGEWKDPITADAVDDPDPMTLLPQVFGISRTGVDVCARVVAEGRTSTGDTAAPFGVNRSTVDRQLTRLRALGPVEPTEQSLEEGGHVHQYTPVTPADARRRLREEFCTWVADAVTPLDEADRRLLAADSERDSQSGLSLPARGDE